MNKVRYIRVSFPGIIKLRNNLRMIIVRAVAEQQLILSKLKGDYLHDFLSSNDFKEGNSVSKHEFTQNFEALENFRMCKREIKQLNDLLKVSICKCGVCSDTKDDRVYDPISQHWYCEPCYEDYIKGHAINDEQDKLYEEKVELDIGLPKKK